MINTQSRITESDKIILESVDSYLQKQRIPLNCAPQQKLYLVQSTKEYLYSEIAARLPRVSGYILTANMETDPFAKGLNISLSKHVMDPIFINVLLQYLARNNNNSDNAIVGAYLTKVLNNWLDQNIKTDEKNKKGEVVNEALPMDKQLEPIKHIDAAIKMLLGKVIAQVQSRCVNLNDKQCMAVAACLAMNNKSTILDLIASDLPITADVFEIYGNLDNIIREALLIDKIVDKNELPAKMTTNQEAFTNSLERWVFKKLDTIPMQSCYQFLVATYGPTGKSSIDVSNKFINPRDCGNQYPNLQELTKYLMK